MKLRAVAVIFILITFLAKKGSAQLEASNWRFGTSTLGLHFSPTGVVTVTTTSYTPHGNEGCSVLSDQVTGALRFYTDGMVVVDADDQLMPNGGGLIGHSSSLGSGKIAADPVNCNRFYIFHNNSAYEAGGSNGLYYTLVDMTLPGNGTAANPKGDVVAGQKNMLITSNVGEGIEVVPVANSHDFWLLIPINTYNSIFVYKFTSTGSSLVNSYPLQSTLVDMRPIVFCKTNNKLALCSLNDFDNLLYFDFDIATGTISNEKVIPGIPKTFGQYHGTGSLCWSPNGKLLYISKYRNAYDGGKLYQYDLTSNTTQLIYDENNEYAGGRGLKMGPDGKMYFLHGIGATQYIGAINNPDMLGAACNFNPIQIDMGGSLKGAGKFPDFLYLNDTILVIPDTTIQVKLSCNTLSVLDTTFNLALTPVDMDNDHLSYTLLKMSSSTAQATLTATGIHYKNTATPPYTDTVFVKYCDDYCLNKCRTFKVIIQGITSSLITSHLPPVLSSCAGSKLLLDAAPGLSNYKWSTGESTQAIYAQNSGTYKVTATDPNGCKYADSTKITFHALPIVNLGNDTSACDSIILKTNKFFPTIKWNDGTKLPQNSAHTTGTYHIVVTDQYGCSGSDTISVVINNSTVIDIGGPFNFCNNTVIDQILYVPNVKSVLWSTGSTNDSIAVHNSGIYTVTVTDLNGCKTVDQAVVTVITGPKAAFTASSVCVGDIMNFKDKSTVPTGVIKTWNWNFGDNNSISQVSSPLHVYTTAGKYTVLLVVASDEGCSDTTIQVVTVLDSPVVDFNVTGICKKNTLTITDKTTTTSSIISWNWNFGDGGTSNVQQPPPHTYSASGTYLITLRATTASGCAGIVSKNITVDNLPIANFTASNVCDGSQVVFKNASSIPDINKIKSITWSFGDGSTDAVTSQPSHLYAGPNSYPVKLAIVTQNNCVDSIVKKITVNPNPKTDFEANAIKGCSPLNIDFKDLSTIAFGKKVKWAWDFGNGTSKSNNPETIYKNTGTIPKMYTVKLMVTSDSGCISSIVKKDYITVYPQPVAAFSLAPNKVSISNPIITFKNNSTYTDSCIWNFGDRTLSELFNTPPHMYTDTGTYTVILFAFTKYGCVDSTLREVRIEPDFTFYIPNAFTPNNDDVNETFSGKGTYVKEFEMLIFDRWGNMVYKSNDFNKPWNGAKNGKGDIVEDVYVYTITIVDYNKKKHYYKGIVTLVR
jgi:gliding motility-associated-like protein